MKKTTTFIMALALAIATTTLLQGQDITVSPWRSMESPESISLNSDVTVSNARYLELDQARIRSKLAEATRTTQTTIDIPMPNGEFQTFAIREVSMMEPALAAKYPDIKTYKGYSRATPSSVIRLDISPRGFHAFILTADGEIRIEPAAVGNSSLHLSYYTKDEIVPDQVAHCGYAPDEPALNLSDRLPHNASERSFRTPVGSELRTYRIAISTRGDLPQTKGWTTTAQVMTNIVSLLNEVNAIFERDLSMTFTMVANTDLMFYLDPATDPFTSAYLSENQTNTDLVIGDANYDVGHMIKPNSGGLAVLPSVCSSGNKAKGYSSYDFLQIFCHELGHQLGAGHSFNATTSGCSGNHYAADAYEPGSGSTIMSYSGSCDPNNIPNPGDINYFNAGAYDRITTYVAAGGNCYTPTATGNSAPTVSVPTGGFYIPISTPFTLTGSATDPDGDPLEYSWEQYDLGPAGTPDSPSGDAPIFRVFNPVSTPSRTFPQISDIINNTSTLGEILPTYTRNLTFRLLVRDNAAGGGGVDYDELSFDADATAGPFLVQTPNTGVSWLSGSNQTITWDVANTNNANVNCQTVNILLSSDGGLTYPTTLVSNTPNDGSENVTLPSTDCGSSFRVKVEANDNIFFDISNQDFSILPDISDQGATDINETSAELSWNSVGSTNFDIEYGALGFTQGTGTTVSNINGTLHTLSGLNPATEYDYYLRVNPSGCWIGPYSFMTLNCGEETLPYTEDFENGGAFPGCWVNLSSDDQNLSVWSGGTGTNGSGPNSAHSGDYYVYYEVSGIPANDKAVLVGPSFDLNGANAPEFCFYYHMYGSAMGTLELQVESPVGSSNWTTVWTQSGQQHASGSAAYTQACVDLSAYTNQTLRPRFVGTHLLNSQPWGDMAFDLITLTPCGAPSNLSIANTTETGTDVSWTDAGGTTWDLEYGAVGFSPGTGTLLSNIGTSTDYELSGLSSGTEYDIYVREHCSGNGLKSGWIGPYSFLTLTCGEETLPYTEDFENGGAFPSCWVNLSSDDRNLSVWSGGTGTGGSGPNSAHSGDYYVYYEVSGVPANDQAILVGPSFDLNGANAPELCFYYHMYGSAMGTLELQVESPVGSANWTTVWTESGQQHGSSSADYTQACVDLSAYTNQTLRPRFVGTHLLNSQPWGDMAFDLITLTPCGIPSNLNLSNTTETSADISWTDAGGTTWDLEYGAVGFSPGTGTLLSNIGTSTDYELSGLSAGGEYDIYVREYCSGNGLKSNWIGPLSLTTLQCTPLDLPHIQDFENGGSLPSCWQQLSSDGAYDFVVHSGSTSSFATGPDGAHSNTYYLYMEASNTSDGDKVQLLSPPFNAPSGTNYDLSFFYHMRGFSGEVGTLEVSVEVPAGSGDWTTVWSISGVQHPDEDSPYSQALIDLTPYSGSTARLRFTTTDGTGGQGDIAFDLVEISSGVILPVELTQFAGFLTDEQAVQLIWETTTEINNRGFEVEHSLDGRDWKPLTFVEGQGTSYDVHEYKHLHSSPTKGLNYYRLKQMDLDQSFTYSNIVSIDVTATNKEADIRIFPNPVNSGAFTVILPGDDEIDTEVRLYDSTSRLVRQQRVTSSQSTIEVSELEKGVYLLQVEKNGVLFWKRVVVM